MAQEGRLDGVESESACRDQVERGEAEGVEFWQLHRVDTIVEDFKRPGGDNIEDRRGREHRRGGLDLDGDRFSGCLSLSERRPRSHLRAG